ncbi:MAG: hypothetical protein EZS28_045550, partial [Streblomastix strix]
MKLINYGPYRREHEKSFLNIHGSTLLHQAPELLEHQKNNDIQTETQNASNIWSIGIMLYDILGRSHPFIDEEEDIHIHDYIHKVLNEEPNKLPEDIPSSLKNCVMRMLDKV